MARRGSNRQGSEGLREERASLVLRYTVDAADAEPASPEPSTPARPQSRPTEYVIELDATGFLWWWSLYELIDRGGDGADVASRAFRSPEATASARVPRLSQRAAIRAGQHAARKLSPPPDATAAGTAWPSTNRPRKLPRRVVQLALILLVAAVAFGAFVETRDSSRHARRKPLTPPRATRSDSHSTRASLSGRSATRLNNDGYARMRRGDYAGALPLLELAVRRLRGTGSVNEAYAEFNLANTRYHLGKCTNVLALLGRSQQIQGANAAIDELRHAARKLCS
jgi:hypothetical protein